MVTLTILALLGFLYVLIFLPWKMPLFYRLFLGLIITWPVLSLYGQVPLPAGVPDIHYHRVFVAVLLLLAVLTSLQSAGRSGPRETPRSRVPRAASPPAHDFRGLVLQPAAVRQPWEDSSRMPPDRRIPPRTAAASISPTSPCLLRAPGSSQTYVSPDAQQFEGPRLPTLILLYVLAKSVVLLNGVATGVSGSTSIASFLDTALLPVAVYWLTKQVVVSRRHLEWLLAAVILAALIVCLSGLYERALDLRSSAFPITPHNEAGDTRYLDVPRGRAAGVMGSPSVYGGVLGFGILASVCYLAHARSMLITVLAGSIALLLSYGVLVTFTRSVWISVPIVVLFVQFHFKAIWKVILPLAVSVGLLLAFMSSRLQQSDIVHNRLLNEENVTGRIDRIAWSFQKIPEHPLLGWGPGALNAMMYREFPADGFSTSHNTYMTILVDNGIVVFVVFVALIAQWLARARRILSTTKKADLEHGATAVMAGFLVIWLLCAMSLELGYFAYYTSLLWMSGAVIDRLYAACGIGGETKDAQVAPSPKA